MLLEKTYKTKIDDANRMIRNGIDKLKSVQASVMAHFADNQAHIAELTQENSELESMKASIEKQVEQIGRIVS